MSTQTVLILDIDDDRAAVLTDVVARAGGQHVLASTAAEAAEQLQAGNCACLLVSTVADTTPEAFVAQARELSPDMAIVALAEGARESTALYHAGADLVAELPLDADLLGAKLGAAIRSASRGQMPLAA
jgi:DNA-binding NtrC family response regulator